MNHYLTQKYESVILRPMTIEDSEKYRRLRNLDEIRCWFETTDIISKDGQERWFKSYLNKDNEFMFSVFNEQECFVGGYSQYDIREETSEYGRLIIAPNIRGFGYGRKATMATLQIAKQLGLQIVHLDVFADNKSAIDTYIAAGFIKTGVTSVVRDKCMISMKIKLE